ncbi:lopap-like [Ornithodoros turicata]|uniref:lopap-like n=1 Tax=Ornithodoros turicata TaxID=34597 RepID=UPI003138BBAA
MARTGVQTWLKVVCVLSGSIVNAMVMPGLCPSVKEKDDVDLEQFMGTWYEVLRTPFIMESFVNCVKFHYLDKGDTDNIAVRLKGERATVSSVFSTNDRGTAVVIDGEINVKDGKPGSITLKANSFKYTSPMRVVATDYTTYAVLWACENNLISGIARRENIWVLSRTYTLNVTMQKVIMDHLKKETYSSYFLLPTDQRNCVGRL